ncbi:hypothetical protein AAMO2058_000908400 [Amorphochlora amoebiformis]
MFEAEKKSVFRSNWIHVGRKDQLELPCSYFTDPAGVAKEFRCPYHGWCYRNDGRLVQAKRLRGIKDFKARDNGLKPLQVDTLGPFVFIAFGEDPLPPLSEVFGEILEGPLQSFERLENLQFVKRVEYPLECNRKVFCDNYLDGGYHVPIAHPSLSSGLDEDDYTIRLVRSGTIQEAAVNTSDPRLGEKNALYLFAHPNFMVNRYGHWMDTNTVIPLSPSRCLVVFDYYVDIEAIGLEGAELDVYIDEALRDSDKVQQEDEELCRIVQAGLESNGYVAGRYAPELEHGMHQFHVQLHRDVSDLVK